MTMKKVIFTTVAGALLLTAAPMAKGQTPANDPPQPISPTLIPAPNSTAPVPPTQVPVPVNPALPTPPTGNPAPAPNVQPSAPMPDHVNNQPPMAMNHTVRTGGPLSSLDRMFMMKVSQANLAEIQASRLALQKSSDYRVREAAKMLIREHSEAQSDLKDVAHQVSFNLPQKTDATHQELYRKLSRLSGSSFNKAFMSAQVKDHDAAMALFQQEVSNGSHLNTRQFAGTYLPRIQNHTIMVKETASNIGVPVPRKKVAQATWNVIDNRP